ncbi:TPA: MFS transporter [Candidatus Poribacteria bacterium]|nr:MFS transporter [Candidatus Poribacteria bacterium]
MKNTIDASGKTHSALSRDLVILSGCFLFAFMGAGAMQQFLVTNIAEKTGKSDAQCSWILAMVYFAGVFWRIYSAHTIRFLGMYKAVVLGLCTYTFFMLCVVLFSNYWLLLIAAFIWGWGAAAVWITSPTQLLQTTSSKRYGLASGIFYSSVFIGQGAGVMILGSLSPNQKFQQVLLIAVAISLVGNVISLFLPKRQISRENPPKITNVFGALKTVKSWEFVFIQIAASFGFGLLLGSFGTFAKDLGKPDMVHWITISFYIARLLASWVVGGLSDWMGRDKVLRYMFLGAAIGLGVAVFSKSLAALSIAAAMLGLQSGTVPTVITAMVGDSTDEHRRHLAFAALSLLPNFGVGFTIVGGQYLRLLLGGFSRTFIIYASIFSLCALLTIDIGRRAEEKL